MIRATFDPGPLRRFIDVALRGNFSIAASLTNLSWAWGRAFRGATISEILAANFKRVWTRGQSTWKPASPRWLATKAARGLSSRTLIASGRLAASLATKRGTGDTVSYGDAKNYYYGVNKERFRTEGGWSYPEIHQHLGDATGTTRPFMELDALAQKQLNSWFRSAIQHRMGEIHARLGMRGVRVRTAA